MNENHQKEDCIYTDEQLCTLEMGARVKTGDGRHVCRCGEPGAGGAHTRYASLDIHTVNRVVSVLNFQHDTIPNVGVVGWTNECLLAVISDRLKAFQNGGFPCDENYEALVRVDQALHILEQRTRDRKTRGVEGQHRA